MEYFYAYGLLFVLPFTIFAYIKSDQRLRIKMIISGIGFGILSLIFDYIYSDYWHPVYLIKDIHLEDFLYGFFFAGILPAMHNIFTKKKLEGKMKINLKLSILYTLILLSTFGIVVYILKINYIYALSIVPLIIGIISYIKVNGNIKDILITVIASVLITLFAYTMILVIYPNAIDFHFIMENISNIKIINIPLEELVFAICLGVGCAYTYDAGFNLK